MIKSKTKRTRRKPSSCRNTTKSGKCDGKYELSYDGQAPIFTCDKCNHLEDTWKRFYNEYLNLFKEKSNWDNEKDKVSCIIGFFCHMYKQKYEVDYVFVPQSPNPYSSKECKDAWKLLSAFNGDANLARKYIYWMFKKFIKNHTITSLAYLNTPGIIRKFMLYNKNKNKITRATNLPQTFINWCKENIPQIFDTYELTTVNDLGALLSHVKFYGANPDEPEAQAISMAERLNLLKDGKLNIQE